MNFITKLIDKLTSEKLRDHRVKDYPHFRLHFMKFTKVASYYGPTFDEVYDYVFTTYSAPKGMSKNDMYKVVSYVYDLALQENEDILNKQSVKATNKALATIGFKPANLDEDYDGITDLYLVAGDLKRFKRSSEYKQYFNWYVEGVTKQEVEAIYNGLGLTFKDILTTQNKTNI